MKAEWNGMLVLLWVLVVISALAVIFSTHRSRQMFDELQKLSQEQNRLEVEWGRLLLVRAALWVRSSGWCGNGVCASRCWMIFR